MVNAGLNVLQSLGKQAYFKLFMEPVEYSESIVIRLCVYGHTVPISRPYDLPAVGVKQSISVNSRSQTFPHEKDNIAKGYIIAIYHETLY